MEQGFVLFDSHAHLDDPRFDPDREDVLAQMQEQRVGCVCVGADLESSQAVMALSEAYDFLWAAVGVHPHDAKAFAPANIDTLEGWLSHPRVVALGEIGLDYHYDNSPREAQRKVFEAQLDLAQGVGKPVILHVREAHGDTLEILQSRKGHLPPMIIHCYSGSLESARLYMDLGGMISFAGPVTFPNAKHLQEVAQKIPMDRLLIETDSPYLAPQPVRGKRNAPFHVRYVCERIAQLKGISEEEVAKATRDNALAFYGIAGTAL